MENEGMEPELETKVPEGESKQSKSTRGGKRPGAGRKPDPLKRLAAQMKRATAAEILDAIDEPAFFRDLFAKGSREQKLKAWVALQDRANGNERQGFFETADFESVVSHLPEYLRDFARFGFLTGWRKGSIESLRWSDVADDVIYLRAENSKTRKAETMPLAGEVENLIKRRREASILTGKDGATRFAEFVFHRKGEPVGNFRKAWASACVAAGLGKMVCPECGVESADRACESCKVAARYVGKIFHDFRRTASRNMIAAGVPQAVAMKITGHRTDSMFRRYAIVNEEQKRDALAKTQEYVAANAARKIISMGQK
jgi:integrase